MLSQEATLLEFMSTCREDVKMDTEYMSMYYPNVDQIYDEGGLTLVSKPFVKWAKILVTEINLLVNEESILKGRETIMKETYTSIIENKSLYNMFEVQIQLPGIEERAISRCHFNIVKKH